MKSIIQFFQSFILNLGMRAHREMAEARAYSQSARIGAMLGVVAMPGYAAAQGFINGFKNLTVLAQAGVGLIIICGVLMGLGFIIGAVVSLYKKEVSKSEEITWARVGMQFFAGGLGMAIAWVGSQVVETLGGSGSDIGRTL